MERYTVLATSKIFYKVVVRAEDIQHAHDIARRFGEPSVSTMWKRFDGRFAIEKVRLWDEYEDTGVT